MKYAGIIIYIVSILIGMISIGINTVIYLFSKNTLNKFCFILIGSFELVIIPLFVLYYSPVFHINNYTVFYISRIVLQSGLFLIFIFLPVYYFYILKISFKKYLIVYIILDIIYLMVSVLTLYLFFFNGNFMEIKSLLEILIIAISNFIIIYLIIMALSNLKNINDKSLKYNFLIINVLQAASIPICILELFIFKSYFSIAVFFIIYNILFIIPTLFILNKIQLNEKNNLSELLTNNYGITDRENEIILLLKNGLTYNEIADKLFISYKTVETHIYSIYRKTGVKNRLQLFSIITNKN